MSIRKRHPRAALAAFATSFVVAASALAGEESARPSSPSGRKPADAAEAKPGKPGATINWWSIPRPARDAVSKLARSQGASVARCVTSEHDGQVTYEFHGSRRTGLFRKTDYILTTIDEPKAVADNRREEQTLRRRWGRLRDSAGRRQPAKIGNPNGYVLPSSN